MKIITSNYLKKNKNINFVIFLKLVSYCKKSWTFAQKLLNKMIPVNIKLERKSVDFFTFY